VRKPSCSYKAVLDHLNTPLVQAYVDLSDITDPIRKYTEILEFIDPSTGRIHPSWSVCGQVGTRWRSSGVNVQNLYKEIKQSLVAEPGYVWVGADAAQIEQRILACFAGVTKLLALFNAPPVDEVAEPWKKLDPNYDAHSLVAGLVFGEVYLGASDKEKSGMRTLVKRVVYGMNYGAYPPKIQTSLLEDKDLPSLVRAKLTGEAGLRNVETIFNGFHAYLPQVQAWAVAEVARVRKSGLQIIPPLNRKRWWVVKDVEEPKIRNTPIQVSAGDIVNVAFLNMDDDIQAAGLDACFIIHGHDACYWHVREEHAEAVRTIINKRFQLQLNANGNRVFIYGQARIGATAADVA
jgi:DNA polymerase-1